LEPNSDILAYLGKHKTSHQILVGFALETDNELENAEKKLKKKNLDFIVLNSLQDNGAGFGTDTNKITLIRRDGSKKTYPLKHKTEVAKDIIHELVKYF
jgi:phosphopantothenoylcysteine decarboxylase/phosphopantothenate--cysteine ligase